MTPGRRGSAHWEKDRRVWYAVAGIAVIIILVLSVSAATRLRSGTARLYLQPASVSATNGGTVVVDVREDSGSTTVNAVQADLTYDTNQLQFKSITANGTAFGIAAQSTGGDGHVTIARATSGGAAAVSGSQLVATVTFQAVAVGGSGNVAFAAGSAVVRSHGSTGLPVSYDNTTVHFASGAAVPTMSPTSPAPTPTPAPRASTPTPAAPETSASPGAATMHLSPASGSVATGGNLTFDIHENSGSQTVNAVQADFSYSTSQYQFVSISGATSAFGLQIQSSGDSGHLVIIRGTTPGSAPLTGDHIVATVTLKATGSGASAVTPAGGSAVLRSTDNTNILNATSGGNYQISGN